MNMRDSRLPGIILALALLCPGVARAATPDAPAVNPTRTNRPSYGFVVDHTLESFERVGERFKAGNTNLPLLSIAWFPNLPGLVAFSTVRQDGVVQNGSESDFGSKGWGPWGPLDATNLSKLRELIDSLPAGTATALLPSRQVLVYGVRSNSWFSRVYDRTNVPFALERICDLSGGHVDWVVPSVSSSTNITLPGRDGWVVDLATAANAPVVASTSAEGAQVWNLTAWQGTAIPQHMPILVAAGARGLQAAQPHYFSISGWSPVVLSPDGGRVVLVDHWQVMSLNLSNLAPLWVRSRYADYPRETEEERQQWCGYLAVLDGGMSLAVGLCDRIEKWSSATGETEFVLSTNGMPVRGALKASRDGKVLAADFENGRVLVWNSNWTNAPQELVEPTKANLLSVSPAGQYLAFCSFGHLGERLLIHDLKSGTWQEMPFRGSRANEGVTSLVWSADGTYAAVDQQGSGLPVVYDTSNWKPLVRWDLPYAGPAGRRLTFSADGWLVARFSDGRLHALKLPLR